MAQNGSIKKYAFFTFITICMALIGVIWFNSIVDSGSEQPGYYRNTLPPNQSIELTLTSQVENEALGTPVPKGEHQGQGSGGQNQRSHEEHDFTPTPTIDWDAREDDV